MFVLNSLPPPSPYFSIFLVFKIPKDEVFFNFLYLYILKIQLTIYVHTHVIFWGFGLHFSNLHINVYHAFDANFE